MAIKLTVVEEEEGFYTTRAAWKPGELGEYLLSRGYNRWRIIERLGSVRLEINDLRESHAHHIYGRMPAAVFFVVSSLPRWRCRILPRQIVTLYDKPWWRKLWTKLSKK